MAYLAKVFDKGKITPSKEISKKEGIPFDFLEKIMSELEKAKLVKGKRGIGGGYFLTRKPKEITAQEILMVLEETPFLVGCGGCPRAGTCSTEDVWAEAEDSLSTTFGGITLADMVKK